MMSIGSSLDERAISESTSVAILVGITVVVTASVGLNVLVADSQETGPPSANFSYDHIEQSNTLIVTHDRGDELEAGQIHFVGADQDTTWAAAAETNETSTVGQGDIVQLSENNAFGTPVTSSTEIEVQYVYEGNRTTLDEWPSEQ
ncbi:type IV pilin [Halomicrobium sp. LC1Hm]|uniref:type IV pilin n=1 Tax=Halomicrobium sp. LC1Hm TaxID=2610902 RepID=UPI001298492E|nr:type IV pilin [Halomicrobium sp. LC1Hm]QGA82909.1 Archaeal type IV pilus assembly protein PilA [Halomicrobium sp. LC1Hm]